MRMNGVSALWMSAAFALSAAVGNFPQMLMAQEMTRRADFKPAMDYVSASAKADEILAKLSVEEKIEMIGGHDFFFVKGFPQYGIPQLYLSDATAGVHIRRELSNQLGKSVAFPAPIALAATWNPNLAERAATAIGQECRAGGIAVLLGPGMNIYRISQCGRNFEYFGEDPFLASRMIEKFVTGVQSTGTIATLKHFLCNNTDYKRRRSNSVVDDRTLHEIYLPAFRAGVDAGAMAVMTSYNQVNGEWAGQSKYVIDTLLRKDLGFKWLVMTDWWSTYDPGKLIKSGQDLDMPGSPRVGDPQFEKLGDVYVRTNAKRLLAEGKVTEREIDLMVKDILSTEIAMGLLDRPVKDDKFLANFPEHEAAALQLAMEGTVLLRNERNILPITERHAKKILLTGSYVARVPAGGGSSRVEGYDNLTMLDALTEEFGGALNYLPDPSEDDIRNAGVVIVGIGTDDSEGWDRPFALPEKTNRMLLRYSNLNPNVVVVVNSGGGVGMDAWNERVAGIVYAWYPGQEGNRALAEILSGKVSPSGKLPITIEKKFADSPGHSYLPKGEELYTGPRSDIDPSIPVYDIRYDEGIFVGYRWYDSKEIEPLYHFGFGLSYTSFDLNSLSFSKASLMSGDTLGIEITIENTGRMSGAEVVQVYVGEKNPTLPRPPMELKGFTKVSLQPGEAKKVSLKIPVDSFSFWDSQKHAWNLNSGDYNIHIGTASHDIRFSKTVHVEG